MHKCSRISGEEEAADENKLNARNAVDGLVPFRRTVGSDVGDD